MRIDGIKTLFQFGANILADLVTFCQKVIEFCTTPITSLYIRYGADGWLSDLFDPFIIQFLQKTIGEYTLMSIMFGGGISFMILWSIKHWIMN